MPVTTVATITTETSVVTVSGLGPVEDTGEILVLAGLVESFQFRDQGFVQQAGAHHEEGPINALVDDLGIRHDVDRRTVDEDVFVLLAKCLDRFCKPLVGNQFGWIRGNRPDGQEAQGRVFVEREDHLVDIIYPLGEIVAQTGAPLPEKGGSEVLPKIPVDQKHLLVLDGQTDGQIERNKGFSGTGIERSDADHVPALTLGHEFQIGAHDPEGLVHDIPVAGFHDHRHITIDVLLPAISA